MPTATLETPLLAPTAEPELSQKDATLKSSSLDIDSLKQQEQEGTETESEFNAADVAQDVEIYPVQRMPELVEGLSVEQLADVVEALRDRASNIPEDSTNAAARLLDIINKKGILEVAIENGGVLPEIPEAEASE